MPSKYGKEFAVPTEFPSVLKSFTREVLRAQPNNIYEFGATYFTELLAQAEQAAAAEAANASKRLSRAELEELLATMFQEADTDQSGALSLTEFKEVLKMADLGLPEREAKMIYAEADFDGNGEISYSEFIPLAVDLVHSMYARLDAEQDKDIEAQLKAAAMEDAKNLLVNGMAKEQVEEIMTEIFKKSDVDGSGALSITEFQKCCKDADIGLTRKEVNVLMHQCDVDGDGMISYEEFLPLCFEMLIEITAANLLEQREPSELEHFLKEVWKEADSTEYGRLHIMDLKSRLWDADLGLTRVQLHSICSTAEPDEEEMVDYNAFAQQAANMIYRILDEDAKNERAQSVMDQLGGDADKVHGFTQADVEASFNQLFSAADPTGSGNIPLAQVKPLLANSSLGLSDNEIRAVINAAEVLDGGLVSYISIVKYAFYILQFLAQEEALSR